ncbi:MAG TPA: hypothetical protein VFC51_08335 [Chloroflexota bacterium]|nr:hypothetical protein [Chloroflexota bacterium]
MRAGTILLVTHDRSVEQLAGSLQREGIPCEVVQSPEQVATMLSAARAGGPEGPRSHAAAIVDADLPQSLLREALWLFHGAQPIPMLALLSDGSPAELIAGSLNPARDAWAMKPLDPDELALRLKALLLHNGSEIPNVEPDLSASQPSRVGHAA